MSAVQFCPAAPLTSDIKLKAYKKKSFLVSFFRFAQNSLCPQNIPKFGETLKYFYKIFFIQKSCSLLAPCAQVENSFFYFQNFSHSFPQATIKDAKKRNLKSALVGTFGVVVAWWSQPDESATQQQPHIFLEGFLLRKT